MIKIRKKDPYVSIIGTVRQEGSKFNPPSIDIGVVISPNPLIIAIPGLQLNKDNLLVADYLLQGYKRNITIPRTGATGSTSNGSISSIGITNGELDFTDTLKKDDKVACLATSNGQTYIVLCRVVRP